MGQASRRKRERHETSDPWTPLKPASIEEVVLNDVLSRYYPFEQLWVNDRYQVAVRNVGNVVHLSIKRRDRLNVRDWRDLQRIKNQLVGPECEAIELYPAESRLVDMNNQFHLWAVPDPSYRFPVGFSTRVVGDGQVRGARQRQWPDGERPADALDAKGITELISNHTLGEPEAVPPNASTGQTS